MNVPHEIEEIFQSARSAGNVAPGGQRFLDNDVTITHRELLLDSIATFARITIEGGAFPYEVLRAFIQDEGGVYYPLMAAHKASDGSRILQFGPLRGEGASVCLFVDTLQRVDDDELPAIDRMHYFDPWDWRAPAGSNELQKANLFLQEGATPTGGPAFWEVKGNWQFVVPIAPGAVHRTPRIPLGARIPLPGQELRLDYYQEGHAGRLVALEFLPAPCASSYHEIERQAFAAAQSLVEFRSGLESGGVPPDFTPAMASVVLREGGQGEPVRGILSGPWGAALTRNYFLFPRGAADALTLEVTDILNVPLGEPWELELLVKELEGTETFNFKVPGPPVAIEAKFNIPNVFFAFNRLIISYDLFPSAGAQRIAVREASMIDETGMEYFAFQENIHYIEETGDYIRGLEFPPLHLENTVVRFRLYRVDLMLSESFVFAVGGDREAPDA